MDINPFCFICDKSFLLFKKVFFLLYDLCKLLSVFLAYLINPYANHVFLLNLTL